MPTYCGGEQKVCFYFLVFQNFNICVSTVRLKSGYLNNMLSERKQWIIIGGE